VIFSLQFTKNRLAAGLRPDPLGSLSAPPDPIAAIRGLLLREGEGRREKGTGKEWKEGRGAERGEARGGKGRGEEGRKGKGRKTHECGLALLSRHLANIFAIHVRARSLILKICLRQLGLA